MAHKNIRFGVRRAGEGRSNQNVPLQTVIEHLKKPLLCTKCGKRPRRIGKGSPVSTLCIVCHLENEK